MRLQRDATGKIVLSMDKLLVEILLGTTETATDPVNDNLMKPPSDPTLLSPLVKSPFHTCVAKLLYFALRIIPSALVAVSILTTRVIKPTVSNLGKLDNILIYLHGTSDQQYVLDTSPIGRAFAYIEFRPFAPLILFPYSDAQQSMKMRNVAKDETAAELVALSDCFQKANSHK